MSDERMKILELIENKIITAEEGLELLNAVDKEKKSSVEFDFDKTINSVVNTAKDIRDKIKLEFNKEFTKEKVNLGKEFSAEFTKEKANLDKEFEKEIKNFEKEARIFGKEMAKVGKEAAAFTKDIVKNVMGNVKNSDLNYNESDYKMEEDFEKKNYNISQEFSLNCEGKKNIEIILVSTDINVVTEDREDILVKYIDYSKKDEEEFIIVVEEDSKCIIIKEEKNRNQNILFNLNFDGNRELLIRLPHKYKESFAVKTVSGDLEINYIDSESFRFSSVSGDLSADIIYSVDSVLKTTSGDCEINLFRGNILFSSVSGDLDIKYEQLDGDINLKNVSGDMTLLLPRLSQFELVGKTISGDIECDFPLTIIGSSRKGRLRGQVGSDEYTISASTTSGDITIEQY